jgi:cell fate (sporulation/competence/biofilm development) regulator YlbF (YheA/YmcA/DUF963 family)
MERQNGFQFSDDEMEILERALAMYAAYTKYMEAEMLIGDESDAGDVIERHHQAREMYETVFNENHDMSFNEHRQEEWYNLGRPADLSDYSDFDWFSYMQGEMNR